MLNQQPTTHLAEMVIIIIKTTAVATAATGRKSREKNKPRRVQDKENNLKQFSMSFVSSRRAIMRQNIPSSINLLTELNWRIGKKSDPLTLPLHDGILRFYLFFCFSLEGFRFFLGFLWFDMGFVSWTGVVMGYLVFFISFFFK